VIKREVEAVAHRQQRGQIAQKQFREQLGGERARASDGGGGGRVRAERLRNGSALGAGVIIDSHNQRLCIIRH
jgi:hypothetical protein